METGRLLPPHGGYRKLRSFQSAQSVYDATVLFCDRFVARRSRTHDQMVQAARSGVLTGSEADTAIRWQHIAEGSVVSATSKKTELKLTGVARASLEELLLDYEDFLRQRGLALWSKDDPRALAVRQRYRSDKSDGSDTLDEYRAGRNPVPLGELGLCPKRGGHDPDSQGGIRSCPHQQLEQAFLAEGGFTERLYRERQARRGR